MNRIDEIRALLTGWWPLAIEMVQAHGHCCEYCGVDVAAYDMHDWPLDHLRPKSVRIGRRSVALMHTAPDPWTPECMCGCNHIDNLAVACRDCNNLKRDFDPLTPTSDGTRASLLRVARDEVSTRRAKRDAKNRLRGALVRELYALTHPVYGCVGADRPEALPYIDEVDGVRYYTCPRCRAEMAAGLARLP